MNNKTSDSAGRRITLNDSAYEILSMLLLIGFCVFAIRGVFILGLQTTSPMVGVKSRSMEHPDNSWRLSYETRSYNTSKFSFQNGIQKGDLVFVKGIDSLKDIQIGDIIVWGYGNGRTIHRVWEIDEEKGYITTKGDANEGFVAGEKKIPLQNVVGKSVFSVPLLGYPAIWFDIHG